MTNPHRSRNHRSPEHRKSISAIHLMIEKQNRVDKVKNAAVPTNKITADSIIDSFIKSGIDIRGVNGVYDPIQNRILDANVPTDKIRLQEMFKSGDSSIGFNSVTDTRAGPSIDIEKIRQQLRQIEADGGVPSLGFDEGSLEANNTIIGDTDTIMSKLLDNQRSTGIVSPNRELEIRDNPRFTGNRIAKLKQRIAVRFSSSFGPDLDAIDAFKRGTDYQGFTGKGKKRRLKFEVTDGGKTLKLLGHTIAQKTNRGLVVSNAGFDTGLTYASLKELGVAAKRLPNGQVQLHNKTINSTSGQKITVPFDEVSDTPIRSTKNIQKRIDPRRTVTEQSSFRKRVQGQTPEGKLPPSTSSIQPRDQRQINKITGVKSPLGKTIRATEAHHIFGVKEQPKLRNNLNNGLMLTRSEHREVDTLNKGLLRTSRLKERLRVLLQ